LCVRFRHPVASDSALHLRACVERASPPLFVLRAELQQAGQVRATAIGKFLDKGRSITAPLAEATCGERRR
jgi:hypothetical protein